MNQTDWIALTTDPLLGASRRFAGALPSIAAAILLLLLGMFAARALRSLAEATLSRARLDDYTSRVGINEILARLGLGKSPSYVIAFLLHWFVLFVFIVSAANAVNMTIISDLLERFVAFLPSVVASLLILFAGLLFARFLSEIIDNAASANAIRGGEALAQGAYVVVVLFSAMTALEQLGMRLEFLTAATEIGLASVGLAAAIAFGIGGKDVAAETLRDLLARRR
jgi:hypothetical protein